MIIEPFNPAHIAEMRIQPSQIGRFAAPAYLHALAQGGPAFTAREEEILLCGGCVLDSARRGSLWAFLSPGAGRRMVRIHRGVAKFIDSLCLRRIEATVEAGFEPGCKWLELLGFTCETPKPMRAYGPDGRDHYLYAWVKP